MGVRAGIRRRSPVLKGEAVNRNRLFAGAAAALGVVLVLTVVVFRTPVAGKTPRRQPSELEGVSAAWLKKNGKPRQDTGKFYSTPVEETGMEVDTGAVSTYLGFQVKLPRSPLATATGSPKIYVNKESARMIAEKQTVPRPRTPQQSGYGHWESWNDEAVIIYPNRLVIAIGIFHPQDPILDFAANVTRDNESEKQYAAEGGMSLRDSPWSTTTVGPFRGWQVGQQSNPRNPAQIGWYDPSGWALYYVNAPEGVPLAELRQVVDSIY